MRPLIPLIVAAVAVTSFSQAAVTVTSVRPQGGRVLIEWQGGSGPYLVETSRDLSTWSDLDTPTSARRLEVATSTKVSFFRITDLNPESVFGPFFGQVQTDQGEFGPLLARHRLKSRLWFYKTQGPPHTSPSSTPLAYFRSLHVLHQHHEAGRVQTWVGQLQDLGVVATPSQNRMTVSWSRGTGRALRQFVLELGFPYSVNTPRARAPLPSDPHYVLRCTYSNPVPELDGWPLVLKNITKEETALYQLDPNNGTSLFPAARKYRVSERGVQVDLHFLEGVPLIQGDPPWIW
ncbi:MAG: hypothetical protein FJ405_13370, partial [Verrucomicrobia bacterium]|nr:hypothetical protein [Verrucomicrobiota bacterium]